MHARGRAIKAVLAAAVVLALCGSSAAAADTGAVKLKSEYWRVGLNNSTKLHRVDDGRTFTSCGADTVGTIAAVITFASAPPSGEDISYEVTGPAAAGDTVRTDLGPSQGTGTVIEPTEIPLDFPKLKKENAGALPAGEYRITLTLDGHLSAHESLRLAYRASC